jgi:hypothetical protein
MYCLNLCYFQVLSNNKTAARVNIVMSVNLSYTQLKFKVIWQSNICSLFSAIKNIRLNNTAVLYSPHSKYSNKRKSFYVPALQNYVGEKNCNY